jgi:hypothetical protein
MTRASQMLAVSTATLALAACSTSVEVTRRGGISYEGAVGASDCESVTVRSEDDGSVHRIYRRDIIDIDHPGNVHALIGGWLVADSILLAVRGVHTSNQGAGLSDRDVTTGLSLATGLVGIPLLIYGAAVYMQSRHDTSPRASCKKPP